MRRGLFALLLAIALAAAACSPRIYPHTESRDSVFLSRVDSVFLRDSIYVDRIVYAVSKGDTVYVTREKTTYKERFRDRVKTDTIYIDKVREVRDVVEVQRELTWWQKFQKRGFWVLLAAVVMFIVIRLVKLCRSFSKI